MLPTVFFQLVSDNQCFKTSVLKNYCLGHLSSYFKILLPYFFFFQTSFPRSDVNVLNWLQLSSPKESFSQEKLFWNPCNVCPSLVWCFNSNMNWEVDVPLLSRPFLVSTLAIPNIILFYACRTCLSLQVIIFLLSLPSSLSSLSYQPCSLLE